MIINSFSSHKYWVKFTRRSRLVLTEFLCNASLHSSSSLRAQPLQLLQPIIHRTQLQPTKPSSLQHPQPSSGPTASGRARPRTTAAPRLTYRPRRFGRREFILYRFQLVPRSRAQRIGPSSLRASDLDHLISSAAQRVQMRSSNPQHSCTRALAVFVKLFSVKFAATTTRPRHGTGLCSTFGCRTWSWRRVLAAFLGSLRWKPLGFRPLSWARLEMGSGMELVRASRRQTRASYLGGRKRCQNWRLESGRMLKWVTERGSRRGKAHQLCLGAQCRLCACLRLRCARTRSSLIRTSCTAGSRFCSYSAPLKCH